MITELRKKYNKSFDPNVYEAFINDLRTFTYFPIDFRVSETPLFLDADLTNKFIEASDDLIKQLNDENFKRKSDSAIPKHLSVPNEDSHPQFLCLDFAITKDESGSFTPKLIELQGFPSLFSYQYYLDKIVRKHFDIPRNFSSFFSGLDGEQYIQLLRKVILSDHDPKNVILLEIDPPQQKTRVDFACTEELDRN